jgi:hypothetical protein
MISWTIPTVVQTSSSASSGLTLLGRGTSTNSNGAENNNVTVTETASQQDQVSNVTYSLITAGQQGSYTEYYYFESYTFSRTWSFFSQAKTITGDTSNTETTTSTDGSSTLFSSFTSTSSTSSSAHTANIETSTTITTTILSATITSSTAGLPPNPQYTYTTSEAGDSTQFVSSRVSAVWRQTGLPATIDVTTTTALSETQSWANKATVLMAQNNEVLYSVPASLLWNGYSAATARGQTGTIFTVAPSVLTLSGITQPSKTDTTTVFNGHFNPPLTSQTTRVVTETESSTLASSRTTLNYIGIATSSRTRSLASQSAAVIAPSTTTLASEYPTTATSSMAWDIFSGVSGTMPLSFGTTEITVFRRLPELVSKQSQSIAYEAVVATNTTSRKETVNLSYFPHPSSSSSSVSINTVTESSYSVGPNAFGDSQSGRSEAGVTFTGSTSRVFSASGGNTTYPTQAIGIEAAAATGLTRWGVSGAAVGSSVGGWFTADNSFSAGTKLTARDGERRAITTLSVEANDTWTLSSDTLSFTTKVGEETQTSTRAVGVSGSVVVFSDGSGLHFGGGPFAPSWTIVERATGVYADLIGGSTTLFNGADTVRTEGESAPISRWAPLKQISPPTNFSAVDKLVWTEELNSYGGMNFSHPLAVGVPPIISA